MLFWESRALWSSPLSPYSMLISSRKQFIWKKYLPTICFKQTLAARSSISIGMWLSQITKGRETKIENWSLCGHVDGKSDFLAVILNNSFFSPLHPLPIHIYISSPVFSIFCRTRTKTSTILLSHQYSIIKQGFSSFFLFKSIWSKAVKGQKLKSPANKGYFKKVNHC